MATNEENENFGIIDQSIKIKNYKCFGNEPQGFEKIYPINIITGKNNSGKSSLIDLIISKGNPKGMNKRADSKEEVEITIERKLDIETAKRIGGLSIFFKNGKSSSLLSRKVCRELGTLIKERT